MKTSTKLYKELLDRYNDVEFLSDKYLRCGSKIIRIIEQGSVYGKLALYRHIDARAADVIAYCWKDECYLVKHSDIAKIENDCLIVRNYRTEGDEYRLIDLSKIDNAMLFI